MARQIVTGIDIGTSEVRVVIAEGLMEHARNLIKIIGTGVSESRGVYRGYIANPAETARSVEMAVERAEKMAGLKIKRAYVSFGGIGLGSIIQSGSAVMTRTDLEITERDLASALEVAENAIPLTFSMNRKIINTIPIEYKIDNQVVWGQALGLKAQRIEVKALFITCLEHHLTDLISTVEEAGVEVIDVVASPVALSFVTLSKKQKRVGCLLADIGAETLSIVIFENNNLISLQVFPLGGNDITSDLALGLRISLEEAEQIKLGYDTRTLLSKKKKEEIVSARLEYFFELIDLHLKSIGRDALLPAGVILAGGVANTLGIKNIAESRLKLPSQVAEIYFSAAVEGQPKDRNWAIAYGLSIFGFNADHERHSLGIRHGSKIMENSKRWGKIISRWLTQFLP